MIRVLLFLVLASPVFAQSVELPNGALQTYDEETTSTAIALPFGPAEDGEVPVTDISGLKSVTAWSIPRNGSSLQLADLLENQLRRSGFTIDFKCSSAACGGYDFRYALDVIPAASLRVDLRDFHYVLATRDTLHIAYMTSSAISRNYIQIIQVAESVSVTDLPDLSTDQTSDIPRTQSNVLNAGYMILKGLEFESGSAKISSDPEQSIARLAEILKDNPTVQTLLVGHSDAVGSLDGNIALSRSRAQSVRTTLIQSHGIAANRLTSQGVGFLAPRNSNATAAGRLANRRVEAVFLNLE